MAAQTKTQRQATAKKAAATRKRNTTRRRVGAEATGFEAAVRRAERAVHIPVGVALEARDTVVQTLRTYGKRASARRELNRFERRGATALRRNQRNLERQVKGARRTVGRRAGGFQSDAEDVVDRVRSLA